MKKLNKGFTLLEVLLALFFLSVIIAGMITSFTVSSRLSRHNWQKREAIDLAISTMELQLYNGQLAVSIPTKNYTVVISTAELSPSINRKVVTVSWSDLLNDNNNISLSRVFFAGVDQ